MNAQYDQIEQAEAAYQRVIEDGMDRFYESTPPWNVDAPWVQLAAQREYERLVPLALDAFYEMADKSDSPTGVRYVHALRPE